MATTLITPDPIDSCRLEQIDTRNHEADAAVVVLDDRMLATDQQRDDGIAIPTGGADLNHLWSEIDPLRRPGRIPESPHIH